MSGPSRRASGREGTAEVRPPRTQRLPTACCPPSWTPHHNCCFALGLAGLGPEGSSSEDGLSPKGMRKGPEELGTLFYTIKNKASEGNPTLDRPPQEADPSHCSHNGTSVTSDPCDALISSAAYLPNHLILSTHWDPARPRLNPLGPPLLLPASNNLSSTAAERLEDRVQARLRHRTASGTPSPSLPAARLASRCPTGLSRLFPRQAPDSAQAPAWTPPWGPHPHPQAALKGRGLEGRLWSLTHHLSSNLGSTTFQLCGLGQIV